MFWLQTMTESTWKILKLDWKTPGFFLFQKCENPVGGFRTGLQYLDHSKNLWLIDHYLRFAGWQTCAKFGMVYSSLSCGINELFLAIDWWVSIVKVIRFHHFLWTMAVSINQGLALLCSMLYQMLLITKHVNIILLKNSYM